MPQSLVILLGVGINEISVHPRIRAGTNYFPSWESAISGWKLFNRSAAFDIYSRFFLHETFYQPD
jgi:hypothetical protein